MSVVFERLATDWFNAARQGAAVTELVRREEEWLREDRPKTVQRYRDVLHGVYNTHRLGNFNPRDYHPYVIREENRRGAPIGLATLISTQLISHPEHHRLIQGTDLDYWLFQDAEDEPDLHREVATTLLAASGELALRRQGQPSLGLAMVIDIGEDAPSVGLAGVPVVQATNRAFAVVPEGQINPPTGLIERMEPIGGPAVLQAPQASDHYELDGGGRLAQLYYHEQPLTVPLALMA